MYHLIPESVEIMVPIKLSLRNFLSYGDDVRSLDFREFNIACISGKNGHGKSALIDAITWALWGRCRVKSKDEVMKRGASESGVEFDFEVDGDRYRILRSIRRGKGLKSSGSVQFQVFDNDSGVYKPLAQDTRAKTELEKVLKMDYESFICSSFILQGKADEFTKRAPAERKEILGNILELDKYDQLARQAKDSAQRSKLEEESLRREERELQLEISQEENLDKKRDEIRVREEGIARKLEEAEKLYESAIREKEALKAKMEVYGGLVRDKKDAESSTSKLDEELKMVIEAIGKDQEVIAKEEAIVEGYGQYLREREEENTLSEKLMHYTNLIKDNEKVERIISEERSRIENKISSLKGNKEELERRLSQIKGLLSRGDEIKAGFKNFLDMNAGEREFERRRQLSEKLKSGKRELEQEIERTRFQMEAKIRELESRINELGQKAENIGKLDRECIQIREEIKASEEMKAMAQGLEARLREIGEEKRISIWKKSETYTKQREERQKLTLLKSRVDKAKCPLCESSLEEEGRRALVEKLEKSIIELQDFLDAETSRLKRLQEAEESISLQAEKIESGIKNLSMLGQELGEKEKSLSDALSAGKYLESSARELEELRNAIKEGFYAAEFRERLQGINREMQDLDYDEERHIHTRNRLEALRSFQAEHRLLEDAEKNSSEVQSGLDRIGKELLSLSETLDGGSYAQEYKDRASQIQAQIIEIGYDEERHKAVKAALLRLEGFSRYKENLDKAKVSLNLRQRERDNLEARLVEQRAKLERLEIEIRELQQVAGQSEALERKKSAIQEEVLKLKKEKEGVLGEKSRIENELERIIKLRDKKEKVIKQAERSLYDLTVYQELERAFGKNGIQALIIENAVPEIEIEANTILSKLTEGGMALSLDMVKPTQKGGERETLDIKIADSSGTRSYETYSGGEEFRIDFALRVAISKFIANRSGAQLRTLVIDEGFGTQDKDGLAQFIQVINAIKNDFDKILVITHVDDLKDKFPVRIEVTKEPGKGSSFELIYS